MIWDSLFFVIKPEQGIDMIRGGDLRHGRTGYSFLLCTVRSREGMRRIAFSNSLLSY